MKVGSLVRLARPWEDRMDLKGIIGIITFIYNGDDKDMAICDLRSISRVEPLVHMTVSVYLHQLDLIME